MYKYDNSKYLVAKISKIKLIIYKTFYNII